MRLLFCLLILAGLTSSFSKTSEKCLIVQIENIQQHEGIIWVGVYDSEENFLQKEKAIIHGEQVKAGSQVQVMFPGLPAGEYAIALFHDINGNGDLDRNIFGIPTEPFAFSGQPRSRWRVPRYGEVKFSYTGQQQLLQTPLRRWYELSK